MTGSAAASSPTPAHFRAQRRHKVDDRERDEWFALQDAPPIRGERRFNFGDSRSPWRRDRDRLYYSVTFHRLGDVTQILHANASTGRTHNRLTHSLKVAQLARSIAERFADPLYANGDVCDAAGLAHDLGHPPYGHLGESAIDELLRERSAGRYEGNAQAFRVVTKLATHHPISPGLDLTRASLAAILKYPVINDGAGSEGIYGTETEDFRFAREGHTEAVPSVEATIVDWSDDISYALHDFDDFYRAGLLQLSELLHYDIGILYQAASSREARSPRAESRLRPQLRWDYWEDAYDGLTRVLASPENAPLRRRYDEERVQDGLLHGLTSELISRWLNSIERIGDGIEMDATSWHEVCLLKEYVYQEIIAGRPATAQSQQREKRRLRRIFEALEAWVDNEEWPRLPGSLRLMLSVGVEEAEAAPPGALEARAIADFISQLTESEALHLEHELG